MTNHKKTNAQASTTVHTYKSVKYDEPSVGLTMAKAHIEETFSGDIEGWGVGEVLQAVGADGSTSFVGMERINGKIADKKGTFLLQISGTIKGQVVSSNWFVVPDSGTDNLTGLRGDGGFQAKLGKGSDDVYLDYWFE